MRDRRLTRRGFLSRAALASVGAALSVAVPVARGRRAAADAATEVDHIVNGSFEDGPAGTTIPGWTAAGSTV